jgi:hypothetical protein
MSRRISHQAEVERRHINNGSWSPDKQYNDYSDTDFITQAHFCIKTKISNGCFKSNEINKTIPDTKSKTIKILTSQWGLTFSEALSIIVLIRKHIDIPDKHFKRGVTCYMIMNKISPHNLRVHITRLKNILKHDNPNIFLSEIINKYEHDFAHTNTSKQYTNI